MDSTPTSRIENEIEIAARLSETQRSRMNNASSTSRRDRDVSNRVFPTSDTFSDLLSRLAQGGSDTFLKEAPPPRRGTFVLVTPASSSPSDSATAGNLPSVHDSAESILEGDLRSQLISLQKADSSTLLHGCSLQAWQLHFDGSGRLQKLATEAKTLGLVSCVEDVVMTTPFQHLVRQWNHQVRRGGRSWMYESETGISIPHVEHSISRWDFRIRTLALRKFNFDTMELSTSQ
ncbi:hypothetical protein FOZ60_006665 [Perkinsus olseni]|uniref:Uncharacterized protein n=1 Tax=Perkinsus olseni TaxID=32597 RepID=A0A7J6NPB2_PEROL|nr:hypothetical protein FOZ60_006665 [Perkinsus olseni]